MLSRRRARLRYLVLQCQRDGIESWETLGAILAGISGTQLKAFLRGAPIDDGVAREIEWTTNRPSGWLDAPTDDVLDD
ncbi:hypothetical protein [Luteibacter yeojuensis]|uniref:hypothetical protein n=1 Tax=Luteibacter yeojuensis TaxID=345309 RepID=UPI0012ECF24A|nr:hypothetical protein [Luteibacter yeojuensis]